MKREEGDCRHDVCMQLDAAYFIIIALQPFILVTEQPKRRGHFIGWWIMHDVKHREGIAPCNFGWIALSCRQEQSIFFQEMKHEFG